MSVVFSVATQASDPVFKFDNIGAEQGLGNLNVMKVLQDRQGFIWAGTENGLYRYDGYDFKTFKHDPQDSMSLANSYVLSLFEDRNGTFWVGTQGGVLHKYNVLRETFTRLPFDKDYPNTSVSTSHIFNIAQSKEDVLWVATFGGGVSRFDLNTEEFTHNYRHDAQDSESLSDNRVYTVLEDSKGMLWAGTRNGGLNRFNKKTGKFKRFQHEPDNPGSLSHNRVYILLETQDDTLWVGTRGGGLNSFDRQAESFQHFRHDSNNPQSISDDYIWAMFEDNEASMWIGTQKGGLNRFDQNNNRFIRYLHNSQDKHSLTSNHILSITQDQTGLIWIGSSGGGLNKFDLHSKRFGLVKHDGNNAQSLSQGIIHAIFKDKAGDVWVGTEYGLNRHDKFSGQSQHYSHDPDDPKSLSDSEVWAIFEDSTGIIWVGTHTGGLNRLNRKDNTFTHYRHDANDANSLSDDYVMTVVEDSSSNLWIGTQNGLSRFNRQAKNFTQFNYSSAIASGSNKYITSLYAAENGALWLGTFAAGLNQLNSEKQEKIRYRYDPNDPNSLSNNGIHSIYQDPNGIIWIGTNGGLNRFDSKTQKFTSYQEKDGLSNDMVTAVFGDKNGKLWLALGEQSIALFDPVTETIINNIGSEAGCKANENGHYQASDGQLFFGSSDGYCAFYPEDAIRQSQAPTIAFTDFRLLNESVSIATKKQSSPLTQVINQTDSVTLTHKQNVLSFEFAALHYSDSKSNQYQYKLEGFNNRWISTAANNRRATFTNLPAGEYTFRVKASNNKGVWSEQGRSIQLKVLPAPWLTWWAYLIYALVLIALAFTFVRSQRRIIRFERSLSRQLENKVTSRTAALEKSNKSIAAISEVCTQISSTLDLDKLLETVYHRITQLMDADVFIVGLYEPNDQRIVLKVAIEKGEYLPVSYISMDEKGRAAVWCVDNQQALILNDYKKDRVKYFGNMPQPKLLGGQHVASVMYWPLIAGGQVIGVMSVQSYRKNAYNEHQQEMIQTLASTTAIALDNASAYREIEQSHAAIIETQQQLVQAEKMASLGTLTAGVAHEINNPTNFVHVSAQNLNVDVTRFEQFLIELMGDEPDQEILDSFEEQFKPLYEHISIIKDGTERIKTIIQDLRAFTQLDAAEKKIVDIAECLRSTVNLVQTQYLEVAEFVTDYQSIPELLCYPAQLNQVFMNLIVNACDAIRDKARQTAKEEQERGRITIACQCINQMIEISIKDNGCGMDEVTKSKLFEPFYTTKAVGEGTGLGLSISYGIVKKHQGQLCVESKQGVGTEFKLVLPFLQKERQKETQKERNE